MMKVAKKIDLLLNRIRSSIKNPRKIECYLKQRYYQARTPSLNFQVYKLSGEGVSPSSEPYEPAALLSADLNLGSLVCFLRPQYDLSVFAINDFFSDFRKYSKEPWVGQSKVSWLSDIFREPFNEVENRAVKEIELIADCYEAFLRDAFSGALSEKALTAFTSALALGLEDSLFRKSINIHSLKRLDADFNKIVIDGRALSTDVAFTRLVLKHFAESKLFIAFPSGWTRTRVNELLSKVQNHSPCATSDSKTPFDIDFLSAKLRNKKQLTNLSPTQKSVLVFGNIDDENYAYSLTAFETIGALNSIGCRPLFLPHNKASLLKQFEYQQFFKKRKLKNVSIFNISNSNKLSRRSRALALQVYSKICRDLEKTIGREELEYYKPQIVESVRELSQHVDFLSSAREAMLKGSIAGFITTLERNDISRLVAAACYDSNIPVIGIQGQMINRSLRYKKPLTDYFFVIDQLQKQNHTALGYQADKIELIGSANYRESFKKLSTQGTGKDESGVLVILRNNMNKEMLELCVVLQNVCRKLGLVLRIKPHPAEQQLLRNEINEHLSPDNQTTVLLKNRDDTYQYIATSKVIVGFYSNALLESLLKDKDVIIYATKALDDSVDLSKSVGAIKASNESELELSIESIFGAQKDGVLLPSQQKRKQYIEDNPQYFATKHLEASIRKCLIVD